MHRILRTRPANAPTNAPVPVLAFGLLSCALALFCASSAQADNMYRAAPTKVTVFTQTLPQGLSAKTPLPGLSVVEIDHLNTLSADLVHIQLGEDYGPMNAVKMLNTLYPNAGFELIDDLHAEEAGGNFTLD